jgi:hypothetical protein
LFWRARPLRAPLPLVALREQSEHKRRRLLARSPAIPARSASQRAGSVVCAHPNRAKKSAREGGCFGAAASYFALALLAQEKEVAGTLARHLRPLSEPKRRRSVVRAHPNRAKNSAREGGCWRARPLRAPLPLVTLRSLCLLARSPATPARSARAVVGAGR